MTTAMLVDDEANLLDYLARLLEEVWPELTIVGTAQNGRGALALAEDTDPDIAFLDIQMPGLSGLEVAQLLDDAIRIVFVTAYDEFAVAAFEAAAVDYLLKPVTAERLRLTAERLKATAQEAQNPEQLRQALETLAGRDQGYLTWLRSARGESTRLVPVDSVVYFQADSKYTAVYTADEEHLIRMSIKELEERLDPAEFWRVHRGIIVRVAEIADARRDLRGRYTLKLKSRPETLRSSPRYSANFKGM